jgi:hypothetical protein
MDEVWIPFLSALLGGIIASVASIVSIIMQDHFRGKRERARLAMEAAIEEHKLMVEAAKIVKGRRVIISPLSAFLIDNLNLLKLAEKDKLTPKKLRDLQKKMDEIAKVLEEDLEEGRHTQSNPPQNKTEKPSL